MELRMKNKRYESKKLQLNPQGIVTTKHTKKSV